MALEVVDPMRESNGLRRATLSTARRMISSELGSGPGINASAAVTDIRREDSVGSGSTSSSYVEQPQKRATANKKKRVFIGEQVLRAACGGLPYPNIRKSIDNCKLFSKKITTKNSLKQLFQRVFER